MTNYTIVRRSRHNTSTEFSRVTYCRPLVGHLVPTTKKVFRSQTAGDARRNKASIRWILYCVHEVLPYIITYLLLLFASECIFSDRSFVIDFTFPKIYDQFSLSFFCRRSSKDGDCCEVSFCELSLPSENFPFLVVDDLSSSVSFLCRRFSNESML